MKIILENIPRDRMRNKHEVGDYWVLPDGSIHVVTSMESEDHAFLVLLHEIVELWLCRKHGVSFKDIDKFDEDHKDLEECGLSKDAPYHREHLCADFLERAMAVLLGVDWIDYGNSVDNTAE